MKLTALTAAIAAASISSMANAGAYEQHFGGQEGVNGHLQGSINDIQDVNDHQYDYLNGLKAADKKIRESVSNVADEAANNTAWNDRQEGVIRQNRGRLDEREMNRKEVA